MQGPAFAWTVIGSAVLAVIIAASGPALAQSPFGCSTPVSQRPSEVGCYFTASETLGVMAHSPVFWHLYRYPARAAAEAAKGQHGTVVESFGTVWLYTIAEEGSRPSAGERVAVIGPLTIVPSESYTARYMEAVFPTGIKTRIHRHSGPEAWYVLAGAQCLETAQGITVAHAGEGAVVPQGPPMILESVGSEIRRLVLLVLHESSRPWSTLASDWKPKGLCPNGY